MIAVPIPLVALGALALLTVAYFVFWAAWIWWLEGSWLAQRKEELAALFQRREKR